MASIGDILRTTGRLVERNGLFAIQLADGREWWLEFEPIDRGMLGAQCKLMGTIVDDEWICVDLLLPV